MDICVLISRVGRKIQDHLHHLLFPPSLTSTAAKDLVSRLLVVDPKKRYTAHQVLQHPWIETAAKTSTANLQKEVSPTSDGHPRSQHRRPPEQASQSLARAPVQPPVLLKAGEEERS